VIGDVRGFMFETLVESFEHAEPALKADLQARLAPGQYDNAYYRRFFTAARPVLERRLSSAISAVASIWRTAWEGAGSPSISTAR
jgi:hypothetical protein